MPVRPGVPGRTPFWNARAVQFQYAPAFDFPETPQAVRYRFSVVPVEGEPLTFTAEYPWAPLTPIWTKLAPGEVELTVVGLDAAGREIGTPNKRSFSRASVVAAKYPPLAMPWRESARTALEALVRSPDLRCWFTTGEPDEAFMLYRYPSKIVGAAAAALAVYASQTPPPDDAAEALQAARRAADYLQGICFPADARWAFHPPTYHPTLFQSRLRGHMAPGHYMTQCGAETGDFLLDVYEATHDPKYLEGAVRIADTYADRQLPEGSWLLFVTAGDGRPLTNNVLIPTLVIEFLERLGRTIDDDRFDAVRDRAVAWVMQNPVRTWNWQGQFEDVKPQPEYENLTKHEACAFAVHLLQTAPNDAEKRALALDLLRFAEDQFVMWGSPPQRRPADQNDDGKAAGPRGWMIPCVVEQYRCYVPVCASSAKLIHTYLAAYEATGDPLHLKKAEALAATLTRTQSFQHAPGRYQTWVKRPSGTMWFNCELSAVRAMRELAVVDPD